MSEKVPVDEIAFVDNNTVSSWTREDIMKHDASGDHSYILEVDIEIPEGIHEQTSEYPLCPEKLDITENMISPKSWSVTLLRILDYGFEFTQLFSFLNESITLLFIFI